MAIAPPLCWVISDGRRGIENQALGIADAMSRIFTLNIQTKIVPPPELKGSSVFMALPSQLQFRSKPAPENYGLDGPFPRVAIGCGRQAIAPLRALKTELGRDVYTIYVQDPRINSKHFDLVIAPNHDNIKGPNTESMIGSPNRLSRERLRNDMDFFSLELRGLAVPRIAVLIGGNSKTHKLTPEMHKQHLQGMHTLLAQRHSLLITTSRRTPEWVKASYLELSKKTKNVWYADGSGQNPYFAFLGAANAVLVTEDSTNMLTEACFTGKPVFSLPMQGQHGKFKQLYEELAERCHLSPFRGMVDGQDYPRLDETTRLAKVIFTCMQSF